MRVDGEPRHFSWPLQLGELSALPQWPRIRAELAARPPVPATSNFETYCVSLLGETLYRLFVYHYTVKQWGVPPRTLAAEIGARRVHLREDGDGRLYRDVWECFWPDGANPVVEAVLAGIPVHLGGGVPRRSRHRAVPGFDAAVVTAPLDAFAGETTALPWRGIRVEARYCDTDEPDGTATRAYTVNQPDPDVPFTRTVETKHASGQRIRVPSSARSTPGTRRSTTRCPRAITCSTSGGTVRSRPGSAARHRCPSCSAGGWRLVDINQDEAILQGLLVGDDLLGSR